MKLILLLLILTLGACGSIPSYKEPSGSETYIEFAMDDVDGNQFYYIYPNNMCQEAEGYGRSANMLKTWGMGGKPVTKSVLPNQKIHILGVSIKRYDLGLYTNRVTCSKFAELIPQENETYSIEFTANQSSCRMEVNNKSTGNIPATYVEKEIPLSCDKHID